MPFDYETDPKTIESESFRQIRQLTQLDGYNREEQQVVMRIVHSIGLPHLSANVCFSQNACQQGLSALADKQTILCDVEMVKQGVTKRMISQEPLCFLNHDRTAEIAFKQKGTRTMAALELWRDHIEDCIISAIRNVGRRLSETCVNYCYASWFCRGCRVKTSFVG